MQQSTKERKIHGKVTHSDNKDTMDTSYHCVLSYRLVYVQGHWQSTKQDILEDKGKLQRCAQEISKKITHLVKVNPCP